MFETSLLTMCAKSDVDSVAFVSLQASPQCMAAMASCQQILDQHCSSSSNPWQGAGGPGSLLSSLRGSAFEAWRTGNR
jgi:hypothetical protein